MNEVKATQFFVVWAARRIISGQLVGKIITIILSFRVSTSENKSHDHRVKETCDIRSIQVTYETNNISLLQDSTMSNVLIFCILYCHLKEKDHVRRIINSQKKEILIINM